MSKEITELTSANVDVVRQILEEKLPSVLQEHGLKFTLGNAVYDDDGVKFTGFKILVKNALSEIERALSRELEYRRNDHDVVELDSTKIVKQDGKSFALCGYKPRARKSPFVVMNLENGKKYRLTTERAEQLFAKETK